MKTKFSLAILMLLLLTSIKSFAKDINDQLSTWDPDLESGFPVPAIFTGGTYQAGPAINILVGNFDSDPQLEFALTALASGPLYAWNSDSSLLPGWPPHDYFGAAYSAAGNLTGTAETLEIVTAYWEPAEIVAYSQDGSKLPGWPIEIFGRGHTPPALADVNNDGYDEIFVNMDDNKMYGFKADGTDLPGWPVEPFVGQELHTPAIADLDNDGDLEIITASSTLNGYVTLLGYHHDGTLMVGFPVNFYGYTNTFPVIGDVDGDDNLEIVVVGGGGLTSVYIYSANGILERTLSPVGHIYYGPAPALADLDGDHFPEIIVATAEAINIWKGDGTLFPGWPKTGLQLYADDSIPIVGDVDGDAALEIIMCGVDGVYVFDLDGNLDPRFPKTSGGLAGAIADIDMDGHNEIITSDGLQFDVFTNWIRIYDLGGSIHGKIEWGQFGGGPEHRGLYPVPEPPSPPQPPLTGNVVFLPIMHLAANPPPHELHGRVMIDGSAAANIPVELRFFNGSSWLSIATPSTTADGSYVVRGVPNLNDGESYYFRYTNTEMIPDRLFSWSTRPIYVYTESGNVGFSDFDIADLPLVSPPNNATTPLPVTFEWITRTATLSDRFSFVLYDPIDGDPAVIDYPLRDTYGGILYSLPSGFEYNTQYAWTIWVVSPEGAIGVPIETRLITFLPSNDAHDQANLSSVTLIPLDWGRYPDLPCSIYAFLPQCMQK